MTVQQWSTTASDNDDAAPNGWPEGMTPGSVNDTGRQMMADVVIEAQVNRVKYLNSIGGTADAITASMTPALTAYSAGMLVVLTPTANNTGAATLNIDSLGALDIQKYDGEALVAGDLKSGIPAVLVLDSGADDFILLNPQSQRTTSPNVASDEFGFKGVPFNAQNAYTCVLSDAGKAIVATSGGTTLTIPANGSVAYPNGTILTFINRATSNISIAITTDTMELAGTTSTGTRTLAQNGIATAVKVGGTAWLISGTGLS